MSDSELSSVDDMSIDIPIDDFSASTTAELSSRPPSTPVALGQPLADVPPPTTIKINGIQYIVTVLQRNKSGKTAQIWRNGYKLQRKSTTGKIIRPLWICRPCWHKKQRIRTYNAGTTSHTKEHLETTHRLDKNGIPLAKPSVVALQQSAAQIDSSHGRSWRVLDFDVFKQLFIQWIVLMHISFSQVESESFRALLLCLSAVLMNLLPCSGSTIKNWLLKEFSN